MTSSTSWCPNSFMMCHSSGLSPTGTSVFGCALVQSPKRLPRPPARITTCTSPPPHEDRQEVGVDPGPVLRGRAVRLAIAHQAEAHVLVAPVGPADPVLVEEPDDVGEVAVAVGARGAQVHA